MQGYVPVRDEASRAVRRCYGELEDWLASEAAAGLQHGELEEQLDAGPGRAAAAVIPGPAGPDGLAPGICVPKARPGQEGQDAAADRETRAGGCARRSRTGAGGSRRRAWSRARSG
jgi:hypothetical protein